jgi:hypothetical protein
MQALEVDHGHDHARGAALRTAHHDAGIDPVPASAQQAKAALGVSGFGGLGQDPPAACDHRVGGKDKRRLGGTEPCHHGSVLGVREPQRMDRGLLAWQRGLVDLWRFQLRRLDARLAEKC